MTQLHGTPYYIAPEVLTHNYTEKCDVWSIGIILYILLSGGIPPFLGSDDQILSAIQNFRGVWSFSHERFRNVSNEAKDFMRRLLDKDPTSRISAVDALQDPWIL